MVHYFQPPLDDPISSTKRTPKRTTNTNTTTTADDNFRNTTIKVFTTNLSSSNSNPEDETTTLPPAEFPHAPFITTSDQPQQRPQAQHPNRNLPRQHLNVLNTILHKSLLAHDFRRASHAFALLLRTRVAGQRVDLRRKGMWGIGAEILLRRPSPNSNTLYLDNEDGGWVLDDDEDSNLDDRNGDEAREGHTDVYPSDASLTLARAYYDRLILQYPYRKTRPHAISSQAFYPALFGLWIFQVQLESQRAVAAFLKHLEEERRTRVVENDAFDGLEAGGDDGLGVGGGADGGSAAEREVGLREIKGRELEHARAIKGKSEEVTSLPPFDRDAEVLKLGGMVGLWIADLIGASAVAGRDTEGVKVEFRRHRMEAAGLLRRAKECGWEGWEDYRSVIERDWDDEDGDWGDGELMDIDDY